MKLIKPSVEIMSIMEDGKSLELIEKAGRTCYKSEDKITEDSTNNFVRRIRRRGHLSVLEHSAATVRFICDRGISHEIVRHRLCAISQESTRYCDYEREVAFIIPPWVDIEPGVYDFMSSEHNIKPADWIWYKMMLEAEKAYKELLKSGWLPQQARSVLTNSLKTEVVMTCNFREWLHIFNLRCSKPAHPQMREVMLMLLEKLHAKVPVLFDELYFSYIW